MSATITAQIYRLGTGPASSVQAGVDSNTSEMGVPAAIFARIFITAPALPPPTTAASTPSRS